MIAILVPTRGRPKEFAEMQKTLLNVSEHVEVLAALDDDDPKLEEYTYAPFTTACIGQRVILTRRWNALAKRTDADYLMLGNDDMRFAGPEWVDMVHTVDPRIPSVIGFPSGVHKDKHFPFPILTRKAYEVQGYFVPEIFAGLYADTWLYDIGRRSGSIHYFPDYHIEHLHWSTGERGRDGTDQDGSTRKRSSDRGLFKETEQEREKISERIRANI